MYVLKAENICHDYGVRPLFDGLDFKLDEGEKVGLIGANGSGKSTLLRILAGLERPLEGEVSYPAEIPVAFLAQEPSFRPGTTIYQALESGLAHLAGMKRRYTEVTQRLDSSLSNAARTGLQSEQQQLHEQLTTADGWDLRPRIEGMASRLRLPELDEIVDNQSGGTVKRVALGQALLAGPKLLLLDEPTNHLDTTTIDWLENRLKSFRGALLMITHDRYFLEAVVSRMVEFSFGLLKNYPGNYSHFLVEKKKEWELVRKGDEKRAKLLAKEIEWLKSGVKARTHKSKARIERIRQLAKVRRTKKDKPVELLFDPEKRLGRTIIKAHRLHKSFGDKEVVRDFSLELLGGERIGIIGPNGCGKTTLIRMLVGEIEPDSGHVHEGVNTRIAYFDQYREQLDPGETVWDTLVPGGDHVLVSSQRLHKKAFLESFLFPPEMHRMRVELLSGGERNRLLLARMMLAGANVLVLDEPTNDLDLQTLEVLEEQLREFTGSLIMVTHDRYFLDKVAEELYTFEPGGTIRHCPGNYSFYLQRTAEQRERSGRDKLKPAQRAAEPVTKPAALHYLEKKELDTIEERILAAEQEVEQSRQAMDDKKIAADSHALGKAYERVRDAETEVERLYARWDELERKKAGEGG
ncbi:MAG: ABC-F family ATP-binding cassette domain-containing protein [Candidatus Glassbacteria bacterium]|nr:ABC-F family ATP-binding cassette domain-containing protein [Candidatus Glassbacteria bacterium]